MQKIPVSVKSWKLSTTDKRSKKLLQTSNFKQIIKLIKLVKPRNHKILKQQYGQTITSALTLKYEIYK